MELDSGVPGSSTTRTLAAAAGGLCVPRTVHQTRAFHTRTYIAVRMNAGVDPAAVNLPADFARIILWMLLDTGTPQ